MNLFKLFGILETIASFLPVVVGVYYFKCLRFEYKAYFTLSVIAFSTDFIGGLFNLLNIKSEFSRSIYSIYPILEAVFLYWYFGRMSTNKKFRKLCYSLIAIVVPYFFGIIIFSGTTHIRTYFNLPENIIMAFISGYSLLQIAEEKDNLFGEAKTWLALSSFIYSFGTFFLFALFETPIRNKLWFVHNLINIIALAFMTVGFYLGGKEKESTDI